MARRSSRIDALRGLAVFGIMLVNVWGFANGYWRYGFPDRASFGAFDRLAVFVVAAFAEQKFYPIFAFLFGAGFALQTGGLRAPGAGLDARKAAWRRRLTWLMLCGVLHGSLLWFGDILLAYSLTGFWLLRKAGRPLSELLPSLRLLVIVNAIIIALWAASAMIGHEASADLHEMQQAHAIYTTGSWSDAAVKRVKDFGLNIAGFVIFIPRLALLFMLGVFAVRRGWLTRPQRHRAAWRGVWWTGIGIGLPFNLLWAWAALANVINPSDPPALYPFMAAMLDLGGPLLAGAIVARFMLAGDGFCAWLAPVGRMALTNYLSQSMILMLLLQGFGLGLGAVLSHAQLVLLCLGLMLLQLIFCHWWLASHNQGPMEALWRRHTRAG